LFASLFAKTLSHSPKDFRPQRTTGFAGAAEETIVAFNSGLAA
jgi:hypothetical protein